MALEDNSRDFMRRLRWKVDTVLKVTGERFIRDARQTNTYEDKTAALRNSIGYVAVSGDKRIEAFEGYVNKVSKEGMDEGKGLANSEAASINDMGIVLVAGMSYAAAVESKQYDVISNSVNKSKKGFKKLLTESLKV